MKKVLLGLALTSAMATSSAARAANCLSISSLAAAPVTDNAMRLSVSFAGASTASLGGTPVIEYKTSAARSWQTSSATVRAGRTSVTLWGLDANQSYSVRVAQAGCAASPSRTVTATTSSVPNELPKIAIKTATSACTARSALGCYDGSSPYVLFVAKADNSGTYADRSVVIVADRAGKIVWYQIAPKDALLQPATWTDRGTIIALDGPFPANVGAQKVYEYSLDGTTRAYTLESYASHEVFLDGNDVYTLGAKGHDADASYVTDMIQRYNTVSGKTDYPWRLEDTFSTTADLAAYGSQACSGGLWSMASWINADGQMGVDSCAAAGALKVVDWSHGNSIALYKGTNPVLQNKAMVSLRTFFNHNSTLGIQGSVAIVNPTNNTTPYMLGESGDFRLVSGTWFQTQHHATFIDSVVPEATLMLFDNQGLTNKSRVLQMKLDFAGMTASIVHEQRIVDYRGTELYCSIEGAAFLTSGLKNIMATCAESTAGLEYDVAGTLVWQMEVKNAAGNAANAMNTYRVQPLASLPTP